MTSIEGTTAMASNISHVYFFLTGDGATSEIKHNNVPPAAANRSINESSRASSPGSIASTTVSNPEMNPRAAPFSPRTPSKIAKAIPPPPNATQQFELRNTPNKGFGLFATAKIPRGTLIICEDPLIRITGEAFHSVWGPYCRLSPAQKAEYDSLHAYQAENNNFKSASYDHLVDIHDMSLDQDDVEEMVADQVRVMSIFSVNNFRVPPFDLGVFPTASRLNHSCVPNVHHSFNPTLKRLTVHTVRDIEPNEEVCSTYFGGKGNYYVRSQRIELLRSNYGFTCSCPACSDKTGLSNSRRGMMSNIAWGLDRFAEGSRPVNEYIPKDNTAALRQAEDLISLMLAEGIVTIDLTKAYRHASKQAFFLQNFDKALEYALNELEVERNCLGTEVSDLKKIGAATECWLEDIYKATGGGKSHSPKKSVKKKQNKKKWKGERAAGETKKKGEGEKVGAS